jgi:hypothetical protein
MRYAGPAAHDFAASVPSLAWMLLVLVMGTGAMLVGQAAALPRASDEGRRAEFVRAAAGVQGRLQFLRELEKSMLATPNAQKSGYYLAQRGEARRRIDQLSRSAAAIAVGAEEHARLEQLAVLVRAADTRYDQLSAFTRQPRSAKGETS